jgi:DNA-binding MarR family transcriptional regulator
MISEAHPSTSTLPPLPCACASLRRAARAVSQFYDGEVRSTGLSGTQFTLLQVLASVGEMTQGRLGQALAMDSTTLTRTLGLMRRHGWIESWLGHDRRERNWRLSPKGRVQLEKSQPAWKRSQDRMRQLLGPEAWAGLFSSLDRLAEATQ